MKRLLLILFSASFVMVSCNEDCDDIPEEPTWKRFEGTYNVTNLENQEQYQLRISFDTLQSEHGGLKLHVVYENFDDSIDSLIGVYANYANADAVTHFDAPFGVKDYDENRWAIWLTDDPDTPELENTLVNDTILFYFQKSNIAFYFEDGVPFYECQCKHLAVKIE